MAGFLNRWAQKKAGLENEAKEDQKELEPQLTKPTKPSTDPSNGSAGADELVDSPEAPVNAESVSPAAPTLEDVLKLTKDSDYSAFVKPGVDPSVQQAAMQKLFSDPHYNIMDGLDIYIDDYSKPDPIPLEMLKKMNQAKMLGLFKTAEEKLADEQAEQVERDEYERRLKASENSNNLEQEAELAKSEVKDLTPDESPSDINAEDSAESNDLDLSEKLSNPLDAPSINSTNKSGQ